MSDEDKKKVVEDHGGKEAVIKFLDDLNGLLGDSIKFLPKELKQEFSEALDNVQPNFQKTKEEIEDLYKGD